MCMMYYKFLQSMPNPKKSLEIKRNGSLAARIHSKMDLNNAQSQKRIVIICSSGSYQNALIKQLGKLADLNQIDIYNLGYLINLQSDSLKQIESIFHNLEAIPIFIGFPLKLSVLNLYENNSQSAVISPKINRLIENLNCPISFLGTQAHLINNSNPNIKNIKGIGSIREDIKSAEPILRAASTLIVDMAALRFSEAPLLSLNPSGLFTEELCQLLKYGGISDEICSYFFSWNPEIELDQYHLDLIAQKIWYLLYGLSIRDWSKSGTRIDTRSFVVYDDEHEFELNFIQNVKSGKWWVKKLDDEKLIPCSYEDYVLSSNNKVPQHILEDVIG